MHCPRCGKAQIGRISGSQYYCWECCLEFHQGPNGWECFEVDDEGTLVPLSLRTGEPLPPIAALVSTSSGRPE